MATKKSKYAAMFTLRPDGRYQGYWKDQDGKRHTVCDRDPEALFLKIQAKETPPELTFRDIAEAWYDKNWDSLRAGTRSCYNAPYKRALEELGDRVASEVMPYDIEVHLKRMAAQRYSAKTVKTQKTIYKLIYENAIIDRDMGRHIRSNPAVLAPIPKDLPKPKAREAPEDDMVQRIRSSASSAYFGLFALFLMSTGLRRGEALGVQWRDVDMESGVIRIRQSVSHRTGVATVGSTKTAAGIRSVPILPDLAQALERPEDASDDDFVFYGEDPSKPMPQATYVRRWLHYCKDMGWAVDEPKEQISKTGKRYICHNWKPTITAHHMRHGYATLLFEAGVDEFTAKTLLGHSNIETTRAVYTHLRNKQKQSSISKLIDHVAEEIRG